MLLSGILFGWRRSLTRFVVRADLLVRRGCETGADTGEIGIMIQTSVETELQDAFV
jgi:hypothetical protein